MIVVKFSGGLGNQMFQYAFGFVLQKKLKIPVKYDFSFYLENKNMHNNIIIDNVFKMDIQVANKEELFKLVGINRFRFFRKIRKILNLNNPQYIIEDDKKNPIPLNAKLNNCYLDGYWQNWEYFKDYKKELDKIFIFEPVISKKFNEIEKKISNEKAVIIHFRRGDYTDKKNQAIFYQLGKPYYEKAIEIMKDKNKNAIFYIFSDDIVIAREFFSFEQKVVFIDINRGNNSFRDMYLMNLSKNIIISNSTFSWWAAWLGENKNTIIAPKLWFKTKKQSYRYYLPEWHII